MITMLLIIALFAFFDRLCGGWPPIYGRGVYWSPFLFLALLLVHIPLNIALLSGIAFVCWRGTGWNLFGEALRPLPKDIPATVKRHALSYAFLAPMAFCKTSLLTNVILMTVFVLGATLLGLANRYVDDRDGEPENDFNGWVEYLRGALLGTVVAVPLITSIT